MRGRCAGALALPASPCPSAVSLLCEVGIAHPHCARTTSAVWVSSLALPRDSLPSMRNCSEWVQVEAGRGAVVFSASLTG